MNINDAKAGLKKRLGFAPDFFNKLDKKKKILFVSGAVICLVITIMLIRFVTKSSIVPLYTDIDLRDAAAITEYLEDKNISYELKDEGGTILVPEDQKYQIRLDLANNGLPQGNVIGFESFDEMRFGETESTQKVRYTAALQGELERTISKIEGVDDVRVHIVMPEESLFVEDKKEATSSVFLNLKPGYSLKDTQVHGITRLVASGVEGLTAENVTVVDSEGNVLSDSIGEKNQIGGKFTADQLQLKLDYEKRLNNSLQSMLERVVGSEKAVVRSNVVFDFEQEELALQQEEARLLNLIALSKQAPELEERKARAEALLPPLPKENTLLTGMQDLGVESKTDLLEVSFGERIPQQGYDEMPLNLTFEGRYHGLLKLLDNLQNWQRNVRIDEVKIGKGKDDYPWVKADLTAAAFYQQQGKEAQQ
jgi:flagellar basal-body M-ring protein/flagellar hook-basal body protein fliF